jgi:hypothetical protein
MPPLDCVAITIDIMVHEDCGTIIVATLPGRGISDSTIPISLLLSFVNSPALRHSDEPSVPRERETSLTPSKQLLHWLISIQDRRRDHRGVCCSHER